MNDASHAQPESSPPPAVSPTGGHIAVMQPYFIPYCGYFRLLNISSTFVIYDCVQFPRRGWVHRNRLIRKDGVEDWITLPLRKETQSAKIHELQFLPDARALLEERLSRFALSPAAGEVRTAALDTVLDVTGSVVDYLERTLLFFCRLFGIQTNVVRSSRLNVPDTLKGQDRILEIVKRCGGSRYVNASGGIDLYDRPTFAANGCTLDFLTPYDGPYQSVLARVITDDISTIAEEIKRNTRFAQL
jgi:hypothetical protein